MELFAHLKDVNSILLGSICLITLLKRFQNFGDLTYSDATP